jgi:hypothetical protein
MNNLKVDKKNDYFPKLSTGGTYSNDQHEGTM